MKCYAEKNVEKIKDAIRKLNLEKSKEAWGSGSLEAIKFGRNVEGGYLVKHNKEVIGWGVAFDQLGRSAKQTHIYIKKKYRKNGLGTRLVKRAKKDFPEHSFVPWNTYTHQFYSKLKVKTTQ